MRGNNNDPVRDFFQDANIPHIPKKMVIIGVVVIVALSLLLTAFFSVEADEVAVVMRFGKYLRQEGPGLHLKLPFGLESIRRVKSQRVHKAEFGFRTEQPGVRTRFNPNRFDEESKMLTGDLNVADVRWIVQYRIADPAKFLFGNRSPGIALQDASEIAMRTTVGDYTVTEVLTEKRLEIANAVQVKLQSLLSLYDTGLRVVTVKLQKTNPPTEAVERAFNEVNESQQEKERKVNQAHQAYNEAVPRARGEAERSITQAQGYRINRINTAKGDVARFNALLAEYRKSPDVTRRRLYLETMRTILPTVGQVYVFDADQPSSLLPFLDLKRGDRSSMPPLTKEK